MHTKIPEEWIDRIFLRLEEKYDDEWRKIITNDSVRSRHKIIWQNGLVGLSKEEIKRALLACNLSDHPFPPNVIQFFHYARGNRLPPQVKRNDNERGDEEVAHYYLNEIKSKLRLHDNNND